MLPHRRCGGEHKGWNGSGGMLLHGWPLRRSPLEHSNSFRGNVFAVLQFGAWLTTRATRPRPSGRSPVPLPFPLPSWTSCIWPVGLCLEVWPQIELLLINNSETPLSGPHFPVSPQTGAPNLGWRPNVDALFWLGFGFRWPGGCHLGLLALGFGHKVQLTKCCTVVPVYRHLFRLICGITRFVIENYIRFVTSACSRTSSTSNDYWVIWQHRKENKKGSSRWSGYRNIWYRVLDTP